jgi:aminoglycoside 3-N-acetyltransferase
MSASEIETQNRIAVDLIECGLRPGGIVLVHSSLSSMGYVPGGAETAIRGLLAALGPEGTLLLPALSYEYVGAGQRVFDLLHTPSNVGTIPEHFRTRQGALRSICPTHSVCGVGPLAEAILGEHHLDETPCGPHSPFRRLRDLGGQILFLGCGLGPNTSMHGVEELARPPYLFGEMITYRVILADGDEISLPLRHHGFQGFRQRYERIEPLLVLGKELRVGKVLAATAYLLEAQAMWQKALAALEKDKLFFVERR